MEVFGNVLLVKAPPMENVSRGGIHLISQDPMAQAQPVKCVVISVSHETNKVKPGDHIMVDGSAIINMRMCFNEEERIFFVKHEQVYGKLDQQEIEYYEKSK